MMRSYSPVYGMVMLRSSAQVISQVREGPHPDTACIVTLVQAPGQQQVDGACVLELRALARSGLGCVTPSNWGAYAVFRISVCLLL